MSQKRAPPAGGLAVSRVVEKRHRRELRKDHVVAGQIEHNGPWVAEGAANFICCGLFHGKMGEVVWPEKIIQDKTYFPDTRSRREHSGPGYKVYGGRRPLPGLRPVLRRGTGSQKGGALQGDAQ